MLKYLKFIKFSHTIFAMPFALVGFFMGFLDQLSFSWYILALVVLCMVFGRSAAMGFNRYVDRFIDARNPRTANREIPAGKISDAEAIVFIALNIIGFIITCYFINPICLYLSPIALLVILGYSYTKRFTPFAHLVLGLGLGLAPVGAYIAMTGQFNVVSILLGVLVMTWVSGFDILYALQDAGFDRETKLKSIPSVYGQDNAFIISKTLHGVSLLALLVINFLMVQQYPEMSFFFIIGSVLFGALVVFQHTLVKKDDLSKINLAFFTTNGYASLIFGLFFILDVFI